jgi:hypothetical protein
MPQHMMPLLEKKVVAAIPATAAVLLVVEMALQELHPAVVVVEQEVPMQAMVPLVVQEKLL